MLRKFLKNRWFSTILNILGLALAFTVFLTAMVQVIYDWTYDRNYTDNERIYRLEYSDDPTSPGTYSVWLSRPCIEEMKKASPAIEAAGTYKSFGTSRYTVYEAGKEDDKFDIIAAQMDSDMLDVYPFEITEGDKEAFKAPNSALISAATARLIFPGESAIGKSIHLEDYDAEYQIVGVYNDFAENSSIKNGMLINLGNECMNNYSEWSYSLFVKLRSTEDSDEAAAKIGEVLFNIYADSITDEEAEFIKNSIRLTNLHDIYYSTDVSGDNLEKGNKSTTSALFAISLLIITIAIINFINFSMASVPFIIKSINTRKVYGGGRAGLICRQLVGALGITIVGFALSLLALHVISGSPFTTYISGSLKVADNPGIIGIGFGAAVLTALIAGFIPAWYSTSFQPAMVLKGSFSLSAKGRLLRSVLVGFQYVVSFILVIMALFISVQTSFMKKYDMGFSHDQVLVMTTSYRIGNNNDGFRQKLMENVSIKDATFAGGWLVSYGKMGWGRNFDGHRVQLEVLPVSSNFLDFFGIKIIDGRGFMPSDEKNPNGTFIMNEQAMAKYDFLHLGTKLQGHKAQGAEIVGIAKDFNFKPLQYGIDPIALYQFGSDPWWPLTVAYVKIQPGDIKSTISYISKTLTEFDPELNPDRIDIGFLDETIGQLYKKEEDLNTLITISAILSMLISLIGILGLVYFETEFRRKEIALRRVHGATIGEILRMLNGYYMKLTIICFAVSIPIVWYIIRAWVKGFAYQSPVPAWIFITAIAVISAITVVTVSLQSLRAASGNPVESLKDE